LFIDDNAENVAAARAAGLSAEQWCLGDGHDLLYDLLAQHGVSAEFPRGSDLFPS
jgi:FMN phosphatase YigB (HAD superfamily)